MDDHELEALVLSAQGGAREAQEALLREVQPLMRRHARFLERSRDQQDEITQRALLRMWQRLPTYKWKGAKEFRGWLAGIARGKTKDIRIGEARHRRKLETAALESPTSTETGSSAMEKRSEQVEQLYKMAREKLGLGAERAVFFMRFNGCSDEEIAKMMGRTPAAVVRMANRAEAKLKAQGSKGKIEGPITPQIAEDAFRGLMGGMLPIFKNIWRDIFLEVRTARKRRGWKKQ